MISVPFSEWVVAKILRWTSSEVSHSYEFYLYPKGLKCMVNHYHIGKTGLFCTCSQTISNTLFPFIKCLLSISCVLESDGARLRKAIVLRCAWSPMQWLMFRVDGLPFCSGLTWAAPKLVKSGIVIVWQVPKQSKWDRRVLSQEAWSPGGSVCWGFGSLSHFGTSITVFQIFLSGHGKETYCWQMFPLKTTRKNNRE